MTPSKFPLGELRATSGAIQSIHPSELSKALQRHASGDWGTLCEEDREANDIAVTAGDRILSSYQSASGTKFWIITEWDRSVTTVLLPEEY